MKRDTDQKSRGESGLDQFYASIWSARWPTLRAALLGEVAKYRLVNALAESASAYELDPASVIVARALDVQNGHRALDMCAAPGGKSLVQIFKSPEATFILNDMSKDRVFRLRRVLQENLPRELFEKIKVTARDASRWGVHEKEAYHRVLLDAPCSGERHMLENPKALSEWSLARSKGLAARQYALFCSAELVLLPGGRLVYSTCSISTQENDGVIDRYFTRKKNARLRPVEFSADDISAQIIAEYKIELERTTYGYLILPDRSSGVGPMYFACFEKT